MTGPIVVRVPASSANLGAGFDVLGMALDLHLELGAGPPPPAAIAIDHRHPAARAFAAVAGDRTPAPSLWLRSPIPMGRGLGFSAAARVAGAALAAVLRADDDAGVALRERRHAVLEVASSLEGHGDNAAAAVYGGVVAWVDGRGVPLRVGPLLAAASVIAWIPDTTTSTDRSRTTLPEAVSRDDAVHNLARVAQLVAAIEHDDPSLLTGATADRLHQAIRLRDVPDAAAALDAGVAAGAWCGWLSGSGPTVAFLADADAADEVSAALPVSGHVKQLRIDPSGVRVVGDGAP